MAIKEKVLELLMDWGTNELVASFTISVILVVIWIFVGILLTLIMKRITGRIFKNGNRSTRTITVTKLLRSVLKYIIWFVIFTVILAELNIDVTPFVASAGVIGLAFGFGAQSIMKDFISGFFIIFEGQFDVGDVVKIDGFKGSVISLGLRTTTLQNWKGEVKTVNNGDVKGLVNFSKNKSLAIVSVGVDYNTNLGELRALMETFCDTALENHDNIIEKPVFLGVTELADSSINVTMIAKTQTEQHYGVERELRKEIVELLNVAKINIPFPHIVLKNE